MSGVVNRTVAEKAMAVKADELIRKPFQPQDLIARVKNLLHLSPAGPSAEEMSPSERESGRPSNALAGLDQAPHPLRRCRDGTARGEFRSGGNGCATTCRISRPDGTTAASSSRGGGHSEAAQ